MNTVERVKELCKKNKIAISKLEKDCGFSNGYIRGLREGKMPLDRMKTVASYLNTTVSFLESGTEEEHYYLNDDAREMAEFMFTNPEYKVLFDASRKVKKEDIMFVKEMIDRMTGKDQ